MLMISSGCWCSRLIIRVFFGLMLVTKVAKSVTKISKFFPTDFVFNNNHHNIALKVFETAIVKLLDFIIVVLVKNLVDIPTDFLDNKIPRMTIPKSGIS